ncbi:hypothetical protein HI914_06707 [Erysiphe necator]|nr:hypothetical protein HI914_06707 [Erysiphe necator]
MFRARTDFGLVSFYTSKITLLLFRGVEVAPPAGLTVLPQALSRKLSRLSSHPTSKPQDDGSRDGNVIKEEERKKNQFFRSMYVDMEMCLEKAGRAVEV